MPRKVDVLWVGDSITQYWSGTGLWVWNKQFGQIQCANLGIAGDTTEDVLHRLSPIKLEVYDPSVTILLIGTNDISLGQSTDKIASGVRDIVELLKKRFPRTRIILMGVFPRDFQPSNPVRAKVTELNVKIAKLADGHSVRFLDIGNKFLDPSGALQTALMPDGLHLSHEGYEVWAAGVKPMMDEIMEQAKKVPNQNSSTP